MGHWPVETRLRLVQFCLFRLEGQYRLLFERKSAQTCGCRPKTHYQDLKPVDNYFLFRTWTVCHQCKVGPVNTIGADTFRLMVRNDFRSNTQKSVFIFSQNTLGHWIPKTILSCQRTTRLLLQLSSTIWYEALFALRTQIDCITKIGQFIC